MEPSRRVLIVEDDAHIAELLRMHCATKATRSSMRPTAMKACAGWKRAAGTRWCWT